MLDKLKNANKVVGTRRLVRAIQAGEIAEAYIARDADLFIVRQVRQACNAAGGAEAIQSAYKLLVEGEELEKNVTLGTEVVTPENAAEVLAKYGG